MLSWSRGTQTSSCKGKDLQHLFRHRHQQDISPCTVYTGSIGACEATEGVCVLVDDLPVTPVRLSRVEGELYRLYCIFEFHYLQGTSVSLLVFICRGCRSFFLSPCVAKAGHSDELHSLARFYFFLYCAVRKVLACVIIILGWSACMCDASMNQC